MTDPLTLIRDDKLGPWDVYTTRTAAAATVAE